MSHHAIDSDGDALMQDVTCDTAKSPIHGLKKTATATDSFAKPIDGRIEHTPSFIGNDPSEERKEETEPKNVPWNNSETVDSLRSPPRGHRMEFSNHVVDTTQGILFDLILKPLVVCFFTMSIQVKYFHNPPAAALLTREFVEIYISLWKVQKDGKEQVCVEIRRRAGDAHKYQTYKHHILQAAAGRFKADEYLKLTDDFGYLKAAATHLRNEMNKVKLEDSIKIVKGIAEMIIDSGIQSTVQALEALCFLTDPKRTNLQTALVASHAILSGCYKDQENDSFRAIFQVVLCLCLKKQIYVNDNKEDDMKDNMSTGSDSDAEGPFDDENNGDPREYVVCIRTLINLALTAVGNALELISTFETETDSQKVSTAEGFLTFRDHTEVMLGEDNVFYQGFQAYLEDAENNEHNAGLAARILAILSESSKCLRSDVKQNTDGNGYMDENLKSLVFESAEKAQKWGQERNYLLKKYCTRLLNSFPQQ